MNRSSITNICSTLLLTTVLGGYQLARGDALHTDVWPERWLEPMSTASGEAIKQFNEAPKLAGRVARGELPPLAERLPDDPPVVGHFESIGQYGGTARVFNSDWDKINPLEAPLTVDPTVSKIFPNLVKSWRFNDEATHVTFELRRGIKWSDGSRLTADDFIFYHRHVLLDKELTPVIDPAWNGSDVVRIDDYTFRYEFRQPFPLIINVMAQFGDYFFGPAEFLKTLHPGFQDRSDLLARVEAEGYISWMAFFNAALRWTRNSPPLAPTLRPFQLVRRTPVAEFYERNPYYWKIDSAGNQLPYLDAVRAEVVEDQQVLAAKAATGQVDFAAFELKTQDFPLFKLGEKTAPIRVLVWNRIHGSDVIIQPNLTIDDPRLRRLFGDIRFRRALSISINRNEMNNIIYFGRGTPRQATVIPSSRFFEKRFETAHTEFDPDLATRLLDEMGVVDNNADGLREFEGQPLTITIEYYNFETPKEISLELVTAYWRAIGLDIRLKQVDQALQNQRARAGLMEMTVWHADRTTDILFPFQPQWYVPMRIGWEESHWNEWSTYHLSEGERGERPPREIRDLQRWWVELTRSSDPERVTQLGKLILASTADNLWTIGTVGLAPQPVVVSRRLRNVASQGYWGWDNRWTMAYHPATWFLEPAD